jgi:poly(hydroxyalkanoate) depolymerase family esterase
MIKLLSRRDVLAKANKNTVIKILTCFFALLSPLASASFTSLSDFGDNPGELSASYFSPQNPSNNLVVLLHGCEQNGQTLAKQSGLNALAKEHQFSLLVPQQSYNNNIKKCFNWFSAQDTSLDSGEMLSIKNMILTTQKQLKAKQVYILGLSAGGAMSSAILINYPELFTAGAVIAGLPFPCADSLTKAISCMRKGPPQPVSELVSLVRKIKPNQKQWPRMTIWTGKSDSVVNPINAKKLAQQWAGIKQIKIPPSVYETKGVETTQWQDSTNNVVVELVQISDLDHGMAVNPDVVNGGEPGPFILAAPVSSAVEIVKFWNI